MKVLESKLKQHVLATMAFPVGTVHLFQQLAIVEFNEGLHITLESSKNLFEALLKNFNNKPFALISNRINSYSIHPLEMSRAHEVYPQLAAYAVVATDRASKMSAEIENSFYNSYDICFDNLYAAADAVIQRMEADNKVLI